MSNKSFEDYNLSPEITRALSVLKYDAPTEVQEQVIPLALENQDLVVKSQTGSGKTASFGIPICEMVDWEEKYPQALILTPTRELAAQVREDVTNIGRFKRIKAMAVYGKEPFAKQKEELKQKTHVVVGTPGRVMDHIERETLVLDRVKYLIIDEADEMLNMGFIDIVEAIIEELPSDRVTMVFSATLPKDVEKLCHQYMKEPHQIEIASTGVTTNTIEHSLMNIKDDDKLEVLKAVTVVENPDSCIIFCRTKENVDKVYNELEESNYSCERLHGGLDQEDRFAVMDGFKLGNFRYLVATDVAARGIDIDNVTLVINYDVPMEKESYVHRTGRTGRAGNKGKAITFSTSYEEKYVRAIERYIGFEINVTEPPSKREVEQGLAEFEEKISGRRVVRNNKTARINQDITKLHFSGGKKKKIRAVDFVGTIAKIPGVTADDIGIITIQETMSYVDILNGKGSLVLQAMENTTIKGKKLKVSKAIK
ncbi:MULTISPECIES: DEAD/DEAH box helicase [unclassified Bacillus (in: firmicutes)]|uniref:DEAD/DEAH box helicase n=1 Tax=unclassified Bacillus (in: firmicutes) TaxID=185979 RepID=UPI0008F3C733|nr:MULTISPECIES: DEAD/DEAH box helicase [unclassified Bacillus (in: firmicutes)]SFA88302.1 Superfamily II DNA and RNA helicase [Bacillus sp. UNCCL13]SFQ84569.1 Superfamily II DNA and RNA helicase [Bacillus sp. cl95]